MSKSNSVPPESEPIPASAQQVYRESATATELFNRRVAPADASHVVPHLRSGMRLVDFGCGAGSLSLGFAAILAPGQVVGFDMFEAAIEHARADADRLGLTNVDFQLADINSVDLPEASFDVAHFSGVLAYQKDPLTTLGIAFRALKPGGMLAAREPQKEGDWFGGPHREVLALYNKVITDYLFRSVGGDPSIGRRLAALLQHAGFQEVEVKPGYAPAMSDPHVVAAAIVRILGEGRLSTAILQHDWLTGEQLSAIAESVRVWGESGTSTVAFAECMAVGWKR